MKKAILLNVLALFFCRTLHSQKPEAQAIKLTNPSFEGVPELGEKTFNLNGWLDCGFPGETPPDVHPVPGGKFGVTQKPADKKSYLGLVVRKDDTWEMVSQRLSTAMLADTCYEFSISLCRSQRYESPLNPIDDKTIVPFTTPAKLRIWGGSGYCDKAELLAESQLIESPDWQDNTFYFKPEQSHKYILFEAFYSKTPFRYNGHLLLDNASDIFPVSCEEALLNDKAPKPGGN